jgi:hypothetical protein
LAPLTKLTRLSISRSRFTHSGLAALRGATEMQTLLVGSETPISKEALAAIAATFPKLSELRLGSGAVLSGEDFSCLSTMQQLKHLEVFSPALDDIALLEIGRINSLRDLIIGVCPVTRNGIAALKSLKLLVRLSMNDCKGIDDTAVPTLSELKGLNDLSLRGTAITDAGYAALKTALPACKIGR